MTSDRDPQITALLDVIEADPPRPGFWDELERRLRDEPAPALELARTPGADRARHERALRRRRVVAGLAAAAAVVAVALGGLALRDDRDATEIGPVQPGPSVTEPQESRVTIDPNSPQARALGYLDEWIRSLVEGDTIQGWDLLGPQSQESLGSQEAYAAMLDNLRTTWSSYANVANVDARDAGEAQIGDTGAWLVALHHRRGDAQPLVAIVRLDGPDVPTGRVEPFLPGPALGLIQMTGEPQAEGALGSGDVVPLALDPGADVAVVFDDGPIADADAGLVWSDEGAVTGLRLWNNLTAGTHLVAVAEQLPDGTLAADSRLFEVA